MLDRGVRLVIAASLAYLYFQGAITGTIGLIAIVFAVVLLVTSVLGFCLPYSWFGINTCKVDN